MNQASDQVGHNMIELNLVTWYTERELFYCPVHFVKAHTKLTDESLAWIYEKLYGRFHIGKSIDSVGGSYSGSECPYFEDPQEAIFYELVWS